MNLLLSAAILFQDKTAEETFTKIEESIEKAKTIQVKATVEGREWKTKSTIFMKEDSKVRWEMRFLFKDHEQEMMLISDGTRMGVWFAGFGESQVPRKEPVKIMGVMLRRALARSGALTSTFRGSGAGLKKDEEPDPKTFLLVSDLKTSEEDGNAKTLTYVLTVAKDDITDGKLWYDPKTLKPIKRVFTKRREGASSITFTETYDEFTLDADIPDEKFKPPEK